MMRCLAVVISLFAANVGRSAPVPSPAVDGPRFAVLYQRYSWDAANATATAPEWRLVDPDGKNNRPLFDANGKRPNVRPVSRTVVLGKLKGDVRGYRLLGAGGKDEILSVQEGPLADAPPEPSSGFAVSADGSRLGYRTADRRLALIDPTRKSAVFADAQAVAFGPSFSEDGKRLAYAIVPAVVKQPKAGDFAIFVADGDGARPRFAVDGFEPTFLSDGKLGYSTGASISSFDPVGEKATKLGDLKAGERLAASGIRPDRRAALIFEGGPNRSKLVVWNFEGKRVTLDDATSDAPGYDSPIWVQVPRE